MQTPLKVIKLSAIDSTNDYLKALCRKVDLDEEVVVVANEQTRGKGQMEAKWYSKGGKSLTFSVFKRLKSLDVNDQFAINCAVSLGLLNSLKKIGISNLTVKWPNDILAGGKKICGILIENQLQGDIIKSTIVGIGINVNNSHFPDLPRATSMALRAGREFDLEQVLQGLLKGVSSELNALQQDNREALQQRYEQNLFRINTISVFETPQGEQWNAIIKGVSKSGALILEREDSSLEEYKLKEIQLRY